MKFKGSVLLKHGKMEKQGKINFLVALAEILECGSMTQLSKSTSPSGQSLFCIN